MENFNARYPGWADLCFSATRDYEEELVSTGVLQRLGGLELGLPSHAELRRHLLRNHVQLTGTMAPDVFERLGLVKSILKIEEEVELFQAAGPNNAGYMFCSDGIILKLNGDLQSLLDRESFLALLGHELGHHLHIWAHERSLEKMQATMVSASLLSHPGIDDQLRVSASRVAMASEFSADRFSVIAAGGLDGALRLLMTVVTGLPSNRLKADIECYLAQANAVFDGEEDPATIGICSHPEHLLRAYALSLFIRTEEYRRVTGEGAGDLALSAVDERLRVILGSPGSGVRGTGRNETVSPEIHEFALCSAVLMASSDSEIDEREAKAIEDTFSETIPGWKELMDARVALERYGELLPVAIAEGEEIAAGVFNVLMHVMLADHRVHVREIQMLENIGRSLGAVALFKHLVRVVVNRAGVERYGAPDDSALPTLPAPDGEARDALNGLLAGIARRGGGTVSVARILRLFGRTEYSKELEGEIRDAASKHGLLASLGSGGTSMDGTALDRVIEFSWTERERKRRAKVDSSRDGGEDLPEGTLSGLVPALRMLRERLVSGDGRSPSVRLYRLIGGRHFDLASLNRVVDGRADRIVARLAGDTGIELLAGEEAGAGNSGRSVSSDLRSLAREFAARVEETGRQDLFVGYPFVVGKVDGYFVRCPLVLYPFSLGSDIKRSGRFSLDLREGDEAIANQAFIRVAFSKLGIALSDDMVAELDEQARNGPQALAGALRGFGIPITGNDSGVQDFQEMNPEIADLVSEGVTISQNAVVGFFPQSSSDLLQDYDDLLAELETATEETLPRALNSAAGLLPGRLRPPDPDDAVSSGVPRPVIESDPSQRRAVQLSRTSRIMVLDGPPGTGKSQSIVNLVADSLERGQRVAVVCEKRVALDVVKQRLTSAGIGHLAALVHDIFDDRKGVYAQVVERLDSATDAGEAPESDSTAKQDWDDLEGSIRLLAEHLHLDPGAGCPIGYLHSICASSEVPLSAIPGLETLDFEAIGMVAGELGSLSRFSRHFSEGSAFRPLLDSGSRRERLMESTISPARLALSQLDSSARECAAQYGRRPHDLDDLIAAEDGLRAVMSGEENPKFFRSFIGRAFAGVDSGIDSDFVTVAHCRSAAEGLKVRVDTPVDAKLREALVEASERVGSWLRFLSPKWRRAKRVVSGEILRNWPEKTGSTVDGQLLRELSGRIRAADFWNAAQRIFDSAGVTIPRSADFDQIAPEIDRLVAPWEAASTLVANWEAVGRIAKAMPGPDTDGGGFDWPAWVSECSEALNLLNLTRRYHAAIDSASRWFPHVGGLEPDEIQRLRASVEENLQDLLDMDEALGAIEVGSLEPEALAVWVADRFPKASESEWRDAVFQAWAFSWLDRIERETDKQDVLKETGVTSDLDRRSTKLADLDRQLAEEHSQRISARFRKTGLMGVEPAGYRERRTPEQATREALHRECSKKRNLLPMRTLVRRFVPEGLLDVLPVWLMSPETATVLFPREPVFDLVVVDEASQCTVDRGLPVLCRGRRAVVAGDDKQMPPTSFFQASDTLDWSDDDPGEDIEVSKSSFDAESLLVLGRDASVPASRLQWHYRSLFEELIAFSNHSMYGGDLLTIPSTRSRSAPSSLHWTPVEGGTWEEGSNSPEARRVVDLLGEILRRPNPPSVGVVTFNLRQRKTVLDEIDSRILADPDFADAFNCASTQDDFDQRPFVKNLESVQGDERDVIIFSLGYAPVLRKRKDSVEEYYVPARFGPLGRRGGERRLNVAISRAKREIHVVSSFDPAMLSVARSKNDGPRLFKAFVEFSRHMGEGRRAQADRVLSLVRSEVQGGHAEAESSSRQAGILPLREQVRLALEEHGLMVETLVGSSEFQVPVAVVSSRNPELFSLAILFEEGLRKPDVFRDFVHIPAVLRQRGWKVFWVFSHEWNLQREEVLERIVRMIGPDGTNP